MKITIATGPIYPVPAFLGGAVQRRWDGMSREFAKAGHDVTVFAKLADGQAAEEFANGIRYVRWGGYGLSTSIRRDLVRCFWYALRAVPRVPSADVVVTNDFWMPVLLPRLRSGCGKVVAGVARFPKGQFWMYHPVDCVAAVSRAVADEICRQTPSIAAKVAYVPNCIDDAFLRPLHRKTASDVGAGKGTRTILFAGRIHPEKGVGLLVEALRILAARPIPAWRCVIIGPTAESEGGGGEAYAAEVRAALEGLPATMLPPVFATDELASVHDEADVFVYPSLAERGEAFGLAPLEAMARGVVPVVSGLSVFQEYVRPGVNGLVFDHRATGAAARLADAIAGLLTDDAMRGAMSREARATAENFSTAATARKYLELFESVLAKADFPKPLRAN